jgi:hypothetical protein
MRILIALSVLGLVGQAAWVEAQEVAPRAERKPAAAAQPAAPAQPVAPGGAPANADRPQLPLTDCEVGKEGFLAQGFKIHSTAEDRYVAVHNKLEAGKLVPAGICIIQGVDATRYRPGQFIGYGFSQWFKCVGREKLVDGREVCVFEPWDREKGVATGEKSGVMPKAPRAPLAGPSAEGTPIQVIHGAPVQATPVGPMKPRR